MDTETEGHREGCDVRSWVQELQQGQRVEANSRRIFGRYYGWVRGFFTRRRLPLERAEELAQETFLQVFQGIGSFRGGSFESWLFAIAANLHRNERRNLSRQKRTGPEVSIEGSLLETGLDVPDEADSPEASSFKRERSQALDRAIAELPDKPRDCVRLRLAGYDYPAIAELVKVSPSTARVHVFTARQRLQEKLGTEFGEWTDGRRTGRT